jgi:23S rRNA (guanosine2251-2'-O)-methyltransferase
MNRKHRRGPGRPTGPDRGPRPPHRAHAAGAREPSLGRREDRGGVKPLDRHAEQRAPDEGARRTPGGGAPWIYGVHAALAAIANPSRRIFRVLLARDAGDDLAPRVEAARAGRSDQVPPATTVEREEIERALPRGSVHQGIAVQAQDPEPLDIEDMLRALGDAPKARVVVLDQVTDPHNVGAILRSAAAFSVGAVLVPERHAPGASAVMAKAASGAMERVPLVRVVNLARALDQLKAANFWCIGLDGDAPGSITEADLTGRVALVLGSEGEGLRRLTRERCDLMVRIPIARSGVESLNVSNAAAIALYEIARRG